MMRAFSLLFILLASLTCNQPVNKKEPDKKPAKLLHVVLKPMDYSDTAMLSMLCCVIDTFYHVKTTYLLNTPLPVSAYYKARNRYKADSLLDYLLASMPAGADYIVGLTEKDISTQKDNIPDWGVFGLGFMP